MPEASNHNSQYKKNLELSGISPSKRLGQNFIFDRNILNKITTLINPDDCDLVIEIGPGLGGLSEALVNNNIKKYYSLRKIDNFRIYSMSLNQNIQIKLISFLKMQ